MVRAAFLTVATACIFLVQAGCLGKHRTWEIAAENRGDAPCSITISYGEDGSRSARVDRMTKGPPEVLVAEAIEAPMRLVTVKVGDAAQTLKPDVRLTP